MTSSESLNLLQKRIRLALAASAFPPPMLSPLHDEVVHRTIARINADDRLRGLFARLDDDESLCRTFLSLYFQALRATP